MSLKEIFDGFKLCDIFENLKEFNGKLKLDSEFKKIIHLKSIESSIKNFKFHNSHIKSKNSKKRTFRRIFFYFNCTQNA